MNQQQPSGSRWEPTDGRYPTEPVQGVVVTAPRPLATPSPAGPWPAAPPAREPRRRHRLVLAGAALGLVLAGGAGGFAIGHTSAPDAGGATVPASDGSPFGGTDGRPGPGGRGGGTVPDGTTLPDGSTLSDGTGPAAGTATT